MIEQQLYGAKSILVVGAHAFDAEVIAGPMAFVAASKGCAVTFLHLTMGEQGKPTKPGKYIVGLPIPGAAGILVSIVVANHAAAGVLGGTDFVWVIFAITLGLSFLMVSTVRFRSFKEIRLNARTVLLIAGAVGSSAVISYKSEPQFALVWLLGCYIVLGILESLWQLPGRLRERALARETGRASVSPPGRPSTKPPAP